VWSHESWLKPYTLYRLLIREYDGNPNWTDWRPEHRTLAGAESWFARHHSREKIELFRQGLAFIHAGGTIVARDLAAGETVRLDTGCLVAFEPRVNYDIQFVGGIKTALFGGEGIFFATLQGPGRVWLQSLPLSRMADRIYAAAPQSKGWRKEEGSILDRVGGLGDLIDGR